MTRIRFVALFCLLLAACSTPAEEAPLEVITHPDGRLYVGDVISFEILAGDMSIDGHIVQISRGEENIGSAPFGAYGVGGRTEAILWWAWDTNGLESGTHTLTFTILPGGVTWKETFILHPQRQNPWLASVWTSTQSACCTIHYITGTDAAEDIETLKQVVDEQAADVERDLGAQFPEMATVTLMPRTLGHGGFASNSIYVSYLERNYAGSSTMQVVHHELVHLLDRQLGGGYKPSILVEGLAVYVSGGHFKPEELMPRAAALFPLGWYIPLGELSNDFYHQQHEVGYLEAGALVQFLVESYGWETFDAFYRQMPDPAGRQPSAVLDAALNEKFGISLNELENRFLTHLSLQIVPAEVQDDLRLTVMFYDTVRRYQQCFDPSAYFLTAWLPDGETMRREGIVADLLRHPDGWRNQWIESLLVQADQELRSGEYAEGERTLNRVNRWLELLAP